MTRPLRPYPWEIDMTDVTAGAAPKPRKDPTTPASDTHSLTPDTGAHTPPGNTAAGTAERKTFEDGKEALQGLASAASATTAQLASDADALLRASLETIRTKAEELGRQTTDWAGVRGDQARELIDERPLTVVAAAFGLGLLFGMAMRR
jgi:ElaB/YqjD/DUF883 family membrane-anchored ribosome-binding protein